MDNRAATSLTDVGIQGTGEIDPVRIMVHIPSGQVAEPVDAVFRISIPFLVEATGTVA